MFEDREFFTLLLCFFLILINGFEKQFLYVSSPVIDMNQKSNMQHFNYNTV